MTAARVGQQMWKWKERDWPQTWNAWRQDPFPHLKEWGFPPSGGGVLGIISSGFLGHDSEGSASLH